MGENGRTVRPLVHKGERSAAPISAGGGAPREGAGEAVEGRTEKLVDTVTDGAADEFPLLEPLADDDALAPKDDEAEP